MNEEGMVPISLRVDYKSNRTGKEKTKGISRRKYNEVAENV